jgi:peptide/nickel transport system permease protein
MVMGIASGVRPGSARDHLISTTSLALVAVPEFVLGTLLIVIFFSQLNVLPPVSLVPPGESPLAHPKLLVLPVLTLLGAVSASTVRMIRAGMIQALGRNYVTMARLNGIAERRVILRYGLRNALAPSVQIIAQNIQYLFGGIIVVESVFSYPGIGTALVAAVNARDVSVVEAIAVILAAIYIALNVVADMIVIFLVPKLRSPR